MQDVQQIEESIQKLGAERDRWKDTAIRLADELEVDHLANASATNIDQKQASCLDGDGSVLTGSGEHVGNPEVGVPHGDGGTEARDVPAVNNGNGQPLPEGGTTEDSTGDHIAEHIDANMATAPAGNEGSHHEGESIKDPDFKPKPFDDYEFMTEIPSGNWFTNSDNLNSGKTFDFGANGYTASIHAGHELLQLTAPDVKCGLVHVRGSFADFPDAILARARRRQGGKSTFGLKMTTDEGLYDIAAGRPDEEGFLNFGCPYIEYTLTCKDSDDGRCVFFSFVKDNLVCQILRLEPGNLLQKKEAETDTLNPKETEAPTPGMRKPSVVVHGKEGPHPESLMEKFVTVHLGGTIRIGCCFPRHLQNSDYIVEAKGDILSCVNEQFDTKLDMKLFVNGESCPIEISGNLQKKATEVEAIFSKRIDLVAGKLTLVVATFKLHPWGFPSMQSKLPLEAKLGEELGVGTSSVNTTNRLWLDHIEIEEEDGTERGLYDLSTSAAILEQILNVASVPIEMIEQTPKDQSIRQSSETLSIMHKRVDSTFVSGVYLPPSLLALSKLAGGLLPMILRGSKAALSILSLLQLPIESL